MRRTSWRCWLVRPHSERRRSCYPRSSPLRADYMMIVAGDPPEFRTISKFRRRHLKMLWGERRGYGTRTGGSRRITRESGCWARDAVPPNSGSSRAPIWVKPAITLSRKDWHSPVNRAVLGSVPGGECVPGSCPAGLIAEMGLRWWRRFAARNRTEDSDVKAFQEARP